MRGDDLDEACVTSAGILGDRVYAFVDKEGVADFPWMTARKGRNWVLLSPRFLDPPRPGDARALADRYAVEVTTPEGERFRADDPEFLQYLENRFGHPLELRFSEASMQDAQPISLFGLSTIHSLSEETGKVLGVPRFRANFYAERENGAAFFEDTLVGRTLRIGNDVAINVIKKDVRCVMITIDPDDASPFPLLLENVVRRHDRCIGIYAAVLTEGVVKRDDPIFLV